MDVLNTSRIRNSIVATDKKNSNSIQEKIHYLVRKNRTKVQHQIKSMPLKTWCNKLSKNKTEQSINQTVPTMV